MKKILFVLLCVFTSASYSQNSQLVSLGDDGKLSYSNYANQGQALEVNQIPDFSYAGYMGGGVALPDVPVVETLEPGAGDRKADIQSAIDRVTAMTPDFNGFRGAILFKSGQYEISGPVYIQASGIVLKGEGQGLSENGGTELIATATSQHDLIQFVGDEKGSSGLLDVELDAQIYPGLNQWMVFDVTSGVLRDYSGDQMISFHLTSDQNLMTYFASKEDSISENHPYLEIQFKNEAGSDTTLMLNSVADTYVRGAENADSNYGAEEEIVLKYRPQTMRVHREGFLKFDLTDLPEDINIQSALLKLYTVNEDQSEGLSVQITANHFRNDDWDENTLTWNVYQSKSLGPAYAEQTITTGYVATGRYSFEVEDASVFVVGDTIQVIRTPNQHWIDTIDMAQYGWTPDGYIVKYERVITNINGNTITIHAPLVQTIEDDFGGGKVNKFSSSGRISQCGVENMMITSVYKNNEDEDHGWTAVYFHDTDNCWVKNVTARYFGYACVELNWANHTTIQECAMLDPISLTEGSRKYSFYIDKGSFNLIQRCYTRGGRHDYITGSQVAGPNVFVDCVATETLNDIGPHHRYATGILFDNIYGDEMRVWNRGSYGTGHGWAGAQTMFWNCQSNSDHIRVDSPIGAMNWGIGCTGTLQLGDGYWESWGEHVLPRSLYYQQLEDRLGESALANVMITRQNEGAIYDLLLNWAGLGELGSGSSVDQSNIVKPIKTSLSMNYPNPFNPVTSIQIYLSESGQYEMKVYNSRGQEVLQVFDKQMKSGQHEIQINGSELASGIYFVRLEGSAVQLSRKVLLVK